MPKKYITIRATISEIRSLQHSAKQKHHSSEYLALNTPPSEKRVKAPEGYLKLLDKGQINQSTGHPLTTTESNK